MIYINNIIIFFKFIQKHFFHINKILELLEQINIILFFLKYYFDYIFINILKHYISKFDLNIIKEKTETIKNFAFSLIFKNFEININFIKYYKKFIFHYIHITNSFIHLKTHNFLKNSKKSKSKNKFTLNHLFNNTNFLIIKAKII